MYENNSKYLSYSFDFRPPSFKHLSFYYQQILFEQIRMSVMTGQCLSLREYFSVANMKSVLRSFVYEYETPKIVTIHSISSKKLKT